MARRSALFMDIAKPVLEHCEIVPHSRRFWSTVSAVECSVAGGQTMMLRASSGIERPDSRSHPDVQRWIKDADAPRALTDP